MPVDGSDDPAPAGCCDVAAVCVFARPLLARTASCALVQRRSLGERDVLVCTSPVARLNCGTLAALLHERARFALKLPAPGHPMVHAQVLRLHCGGLEGLRTALGAERSDVHDMVVAGQERHGSLTELPWDAIVQAVSAWAPRSRGRRGGS